MFARLLRSLRWIRSPRQVQGQYTIVFTQHPIGVAHALFAYYRFGDWRGPQARTRRALCGVDTSATWSERDRLVWPAEALCQGCRQIFGDVDQAV